MDNEDCLVEIEIIQNRRTEIIRVPYFVAGMYKILKDHSKNDGEKLLVLLEQIDDMKINVRNSLFKKPGIQICVQR